MNTYQATPIMGPLTAIVNLWKRKTDFSGRSRRSEFWWGNLGLLIFACVGGSLWLIISFILSSIISDYIFPNDSEKAGKIYIFIFCISIALLLIVYYYFFAGLMIRRLHDTGRSGWWTAAHVVSVPISMAALLLWAAIWYVPELKAEFYAVANTFITDPALWTSKWGILSMGTVALFAATLIIFVVTVAFCLQDSQPGTNRFGASPKYIEQN